ncbi:MULTISPECIES: hypothetical protein [unclassified Nocardia]|uniref:hypothetical protein n=1 Tax=unclassified Nocardia TaxID=2637762 RepID=UPI001CE42C0D|nr:MULTISPECIES: hypothetical protein [unclassified Nocardia]
MTRSDSNEPGQEHNPFDTGLPMLRLPAKAQPKRKARRGSGRRAPRPEPNQGARTVRGDEDWQRWLDPAPEKPVIQPEPEPGRYRRDPADAEPYEENRTVVPSIIDRTGGNPGLGLRRPRRRDEPASSGNRLLPVLIALGVTVAIVAVVLVAFKASGKTKHPLAPTTSVAAQPTAGSSAAATSEPVSAVATPGCPQQRTPDVVSGTDPGGTGDGPSAILAFERAYYVQRSGYAARAVVAPDATVPPAEQIQRGINQIADGTRYCVRITPTPGGDGGQMRWQVQLTQQQPGQDAQTFTQVITTRTAADRTLITAISAG